MQVIVQKYMYLYKKLKFIVKFVMVCGYFKIDTHHKVNKISVADQEDKIWFIGYRPNH